MANCVNCEHLFLEVIDGNECKARCKLSTPPKKGKVITWAMTSVVPLGVAMPMGDGLFRGQVKVKETGEKRVFEDLKKRKTPSWCKADVLG